MISHGEIADCVVLVTGFKSLEDVAAPIKWVPYPFEDLVDPFKVANKASLRLVAMCVLLDKEAPAAQLCGGVQLSPKLLLLVIC